jgi:HAD superfamily hydrolase (TIGR01457 family)
MPDSLTTNDLRRRLAAIRTFAIDMDGTIYLGGSLFSFTRDFLAGLSDRGRGFLFVTNNSSRNANEYVEKLRRMDLEVPVEKIYTSGDATIEYLRAANLGRRVFLLGTRSLQESFVAAGFVMDSDEPEIVVLGFDTTLIYENLDRAARFIRRGIPFIATHPDLNCPIEAGEMMLDCGAMAAALIAATGRTPTYIGKPHAPMVDGLLRRAGCRREEMAMIGDRLTTDIRTGVDHGIFSILVLTGETTREDLQRSAVQPDLVLERIVDLLEYF